MLNDINLLTIDNISKSYGEKTLFENINLTINDFDKLGLIGVNGTGKSTLLKIIMGLETKDTGQITSMRDIKIEYLSQSPLYNDLSTVIEHVFKGNSESLNSIRDYEELIKLTEQEPADLKLQERLLRLTEEINKLDLWDYEIQIKTILTKLGITNFHQKISELSGGQKKRVALASALISPCDLLILDEPTNHMDNDVIDWLEKYLKNRKGALMMITHDRYFLDRVINKIIELDHGKLYSYSGNYSYFVEKRIERQLNDTALEHKRISLYKKELAWMRKSAKARTTKQKARIQRFEALENTKDNVHDLTLTIPVAHSRLGNKIIEIENISKSYTSSPLIKDFSYILLKDDRIGIIGDNGTGKSTLLNIITNKITPDKGNINIGSTVKIAYFSQESDEMDENMRAIEYIKEVAEYFHTADGSIISAGQIMEIFLFTNEIQWTKISRLSGGERRRLYLLKILMSEPNVLILDEPTNDFDLDTLKVLESYLDDFQGAVISVSHDRYFLDRTCKRIFSFEGKGQIVEHTGNYSDYVAYKLAEEEDTIQLKAQTVHPVQIEIKQKTQKTKFTYKEKIEFEQLPKKIEILEGRLEIIEEKIRHITTDFVKLNEYTIEKDAIEEELLSKLERQEYLIKLENEFKNPNN